MKATIYTAYHRPAPLLQSPSVQPIHVGRALAAAPLERMPGDDTGDNISDRNPAYCELTALYWAWKNDRESSHLGLMHYRRMLDFDQSARFGQAEVPLDHFDIADYLRRTEAWLAAHPEIDLVLPQDHVLGRTMADNYAKAHHARDFDLARSVIAGHYPDWLPAFDRAAGGRRLLLGNMMLMRRALFEPYCAWLFDILDRVAAARGDGARDNPTQARYAGFLAERLMTVYVAHLLETRPELQVQRVHILNLARATVVPYLDGGLNGPEHVNIAFSSDRAYVPHAAAMLASVMAHADPARHYSFFFLHSGVDARSCDLLRSVVLGPGAGPGGGAGPKVDWHQINVGHRFSGSYRSASRAPSNATYNRFLLFDLLPGLDRLLYMDVDMIALGDVAEIFDSPLGDCQIGAVTDWIMTRSLTGKITTVDPQVPDLYQYQREVLGLSDAQIGRYFNAGLLLLNFAAMDCRKVGRELLELAGSTRYLFRDQDILNSYFKDSLMVLPGRYNVMNTGEAGYARVPQANYALAMEARRDPLVIHYAARDFKPWQGKAVLFAAPYWEALIRTPFYAEVLAGLAPQRDHGPHRKTDSGLVAAGRTLAERVPVLKPALLGIYRQLQRLGGGR
ncbi:DUF4422 domain-containing protein [Frigidibacter sp. ROC022]|uniref:DUF4422 domain-containing protein n=1 Tax=Frigidibacter sp. ROC022 TaxID=2971796 RepID=UPI00215A6B46|nr:DUF4422 domain-containing protein [Frigidibacter sp. ROC022]MCR8726828.1 DUF4422 domain-containing protein [Frigidibacter sp. ROC022]